MEQRVNLNNKGNFRSLSFVDFFHFCRCLPFFFHFTGLSLYRFLSTNVSSAIFLHSCVWSSESEDSSFGLMGSCCSAQNTTANPQCGTNANCVGKSGNVTIKTSCKVSSATVPSSPQIDGEILQSSDLKRFSYSKLQDATSNFSPDFLLGRGDFGPVFKGSDAGTTIAIKMLNKKGCQGQQEWLAEIKYLGQLYHPNLVKLIGYCLEDEYRLLVYEYMPNGSLDNHLFERAEDSHFQPLNWNLRVKVALDAAKCLSFLHYKADVIYRDFKTSNILLDSNYNAKLCDFGLARDGPVGSKTHVTTRVLGTEGYAAPEYIRTGHLTLKSDVYSFGIVLLEMISGRRAIEKSKPAEEQNLGCWARSVNRRKLPQLVNPTIVGEYSTSNVIKVVQLAIQCVSLDPRYRPTMKDISTVLEQVQDMNHNTNNNAESLEIANHPQ